ncbi:translesion DNA synthesis-associated protein ImuA [Xylophilus sp. GOD-11R]|uniref:translesion DNA synthesis-associated protein ImuA n=1 Tax=Xylophilus sp. GOD-11R TaxID=3089814 RepID=UPI00298D309E|nr:translesion DNA synthesis-associated protein ImuA [Xylophilus sp. GOD-11R]WPB59285.1 translesion DNA synthesis-associated protein ImuA [Xylophilus sp. GOD-11R]
MPVAAILQPAYLPGALSQIWSGDSLAHAESEIESSGFPALDAELPGGGWPVGAMSEVLHAGAETFAWPLLLPALSRLVSAQGRPVALVGAPHRPFGPALAAQGLPPEALLWVRCDAANARLWACEQSLRCRDVSAVVAWLPQARVGDLRRLQLAAAQYERLLWVFRPQGSAGQSSPARLRLSVEQGDSADTMTLHLLKRRGPPLSRPIPVASQPARLAAVLEASRRRRAQRMPEPQAASATGATVVRLESFFLASKAEHALDRTSVAA